MEPQHVGRAIVATILAAVAARMWTIFEGGLEILHFVALAALILIVGLAWTPKTLSSITSFSVALLCSAGIWLFVLWMLRKGAFPIVPPVP